MAYLGRQPVLGNFVKLDAITVVNGQAAYTMQNGGVNFTDYTTVNQFLVSLNGTIQAATDSFTVSGSTITFASNLSTGDVIDFIIVFGNSLSAGTVSDSAITTAKLADSSVSLAKLTATGTKDATTFLRGDNTFAEAGGKFESALLHVRDEKASGTDGGGSTGSSDNIRDLNTVVTNEISGASLSSNQITLPTGTYYIDGSAPAYAVNKHRVLLYNTTDSSVELLGTHGYVRTTNAHVVPSFITGRFTISAQKVFEIRHYTNSTQAGSGLGVSSDDSRNGIFADIKIWKVA
jgi:hypothetical protein